MVIMDPLFYIKNIDLQMSQNNGNLEKILPPGQLEIWHWWVKRRRTRPQLENQGGLV